MNFSRQFFVCSAAFTLVLLPEPVYAEPLFNASIPGIESVNASPTPVFLSNRTERVDRDVESNVIGQATHQEIAAAAYATLRGSSSADYLNVREFFPIFSGAGTGAQESSGFSLDDLVITGPPGNILVSFNFTISGGLIATASGDSMVSNAFAKAGVGYGSSFAAGGNDLGRIDVDRDGNVSKSGIFTMLDMGGTVMGTTPALTTFAGDTELQFGLSLETFAAAGVGYGAGLGYAYASSSFFGGFSTNGPVANLPEGYTLNSADGRIVDNRFVGPEPGDYNGDDIVNAADYVVWRKGLGTIYTQSDYTIWRAHFGETIGSGAGAVGSASGAVPEPNSQLMLFTGILAIVVALLSFRRGIGNGLTACKSDALAIQAVQNCTRP